MKRLKKEERRRKILDSAIKVFARKNYQAATTAEIAKEAGVSEALIYQHFKSKKELFIASIEETGAFFVENLREILKSYSSDPIEGFRSVYRFYFNYLKRDPTLAKMSLMIIAEADDPDIKKSLKKYLERAANILGKAISNAQKKGLIIDNFDPKSMAWLLVGNYNLLALLKLIDNLDTFDENSVIKIVEPFIKVPSKT